MKWSKYRELMSMVNTLMIDSPLPSNINYWYNLGSLLALCLFLQIATGIFLAMYYVSHISLSFYSVDYIMREVNGGWIIRYLHANGASFFFLVCYLHIGRGLYYGSYNSPRAVVWTIGVILFLVMIITAFLGYVLPWGQMSFWAATVMFLSLLVL